MTGEAIEPDQLFTPAIVIDAAVVRRNLQRLADYTRRHNLRVRPHTKTHKSAQLARLQLEYGAQGLTVAKAGEAEVMSRATDDLLVAYPVVDEARARALAALAQGRHIKVAVDSQAAIDVLSRAAHSAGATLGVLVDLDVGLHRTGVQNPEDAVALARYAKSRSSLALEGLFFYPGHIKDASDTSIAQLKQVGDLVERTLELWRKDLPAAIVSGGSTPTAFISHHLPSVTEIRPGTYIFYDMNGVHGGYAKIEDCAARIHATVVSTAVPGQFVLDCGSKTLTSDRCGPAPDSGHGHILEYPQAKITKLTEEHAQVDANGCDPLPKPGDRVTVIPNHICPCVNLQDSVYWHDDGRIIRLAVDARGKVF